jgi:hypothetical protein
MKKHSLLFLAALSFTATIKSEDAITVWITKPRVKMVPSVYSYPGYALQASGALYALAGIKGLLSNETPSKKEVSPKKALEIRIKKAQDENKVWSGTSLVLVGILTKIATDLFIGNYGMETKTDIKA